MEEHGDWEEAAELLGGEFLEGLALDLSPDFDGWLQNERDWWRTRLKTILDQAVLGHSRRGRYAEALQLAQRMLQIEPWDEEAHRAVMRFFAWTGQRGQAIRQYTQCQDILRAELDVEPAAETKALYEQILAGSLDLPAQLPVFLTSGKARRAFKRPPFVGRERELAQLNAFLDDAVRGNGQVIFVTGSPGQGKTALLENFGLQAMQRVPQLLVASGKCNAFSGVGDPFLPYRDIMTILTGDLEGRWDVGNISKEHARRLWMAHSCIIEILLEQGPQLLDVLIPGNELLSRSLSVNQGEASWLPRLQRVVRQKAAASTEFEPSYLFQQVTNVLVTVSRQYPLLLILDDIQWADTSSLALLFHLGRRVAEADAHMLIACAYRPAEVCSWPQR